MSDYDSKRNDAGFRHFPLVLLNTNPFQLFLVSATGNIFLTIYLSPKTSGAHTAVTHPAAAPASGLLIFGAPLLPEGIPILI